MSVAVPSDRSPETGPRAGAGRRFTRFIGVNLGGGRGKTTAVARLEAAPTGGVRLGMDQILIPQLDSRHRPCNFVSLLPRIRTEREDPR